MSQRIKISEFPLKTVNGTEKLVVVDNGQNYLINITAIPQLVEVLEELDQIHAELDTKLSSVITGSVIPSADSVMIPDHQNSYLSFTYHGSKSYIVVLDDGFPQWGTLTLRNTSEFGSLVVSGELSVVLDGNQSSLAVPPKGALQLIKADVATWHII